MPRTPRGPCRPRRIPAEHEKRGGEAKNGWANHTPRTTRRDHLEITREVSADCDTAASDWYWKSFEEIGKSVGSGACFSAFVQDTRQNSGCCAILPARGQTLILIRVVIANNVRLLPKAKRGLTEATEAL